MKDTDGNKPDNVIKFPEVKPQSRKITPEELSEKLSKVTRLLNQHSDERSDIFHELMIVNERLDLHMKLLQRLTDEVVILRSKLALTEEDK
jgi:hypothetical protein